MKIYGFPTFSISKVLLAAGFLGIDYRFVVLDTVEGEPRRPGHIARQLYSAANGAANA